MSKNSQQRFTSVLSPLFKVPEGVDSKQISEAPMQFVYDQARALKPIIVEAIGGNNNVTHVPGDILNVSWNVVDNPFASLLEFDPNFGLDAETGGFTTFPSGIRWYMDYFSMSWTKVVATDDIRVIHRYAMLREVSNIDMRVFRDTANGNAGIQGWGEVTLGTAMPNYMTRHMRDGFLGRFQLRVDTPVANANDITINFVRGRAVGYPIGTTRGG
jgi:hypothetical protein